MKLYLAGPEVFLPDAVAVGRQKLALCRAFGFTGLYALETEEAAPRDAPGIYQTCLAMMRQADAAIANLTPFRGSGADPGTAMEVGFLVARGKPVWAYSNVAATLEDRVRADAGARLTRERDGGWRDQDGLAIEPFGLAENLMLACATKLPIVVHDAPAAARYRDLTAFRTCLEHARAALLD
ncbi:MAG: nucleoside 2-deoxyribosyltransferase [Alphaproteobacteria bacterium]|nr:nucleoside 2-deoxyribosyltransferase [Alphaproteobacteria bacterium]